MHFSSKSALTLAAFAALGAAATRPAAAQGLNVGTFDASGKGASGSATVSGAGTQASGAFTFTGSAGAGTSAYKTVRLLNASTFILNGGGSISSFLGLSGTSTATLNGGSVNQVLSSDTSTTNVYGGTVTIIHEIGGSTANVYGGVVPTFETDEASILDVFGTGLTETFLGFNPATGLSPATSFYALTGTLSDGSALNAQYADVGGILLFNGVVAAPAVPEASTTVSFGLLLALGLGGLVIAAKRKKTDVKTAPSL